MANKPQPPSLYLGYGSNLWQHQMATRCPTSQYMGIARLPGYQWLINERGYANVVETRVDGGGDGDGDGDNGVYGLVYTLQRDDEARLDKSEGVPHAYTKEKHACIFWAAASSTPPSSSTSTSTAPPSACKINTRLPPTTTHAPMLVYIDRKRIAPARPRAEYVHRMNRGIHDAVACGVPDDYVKRVIRKYIPADEGDDEEGPGSAVEA